MIVQFNDFLIERSNFALPNKINVTLLPGCLLWLKGENASGKSTLLKQLAGILPIAAESLLYVKASHETPYTYIGENIRRNIIFIGHKHGMIEDLSVRQNLQFWAELYDAEILLPSAISYFNLMDCLDVEISKLSAGQKKKVSLSRLLLSSAEIWLLDEADNNLDQESLAKLQQLIDAKICASGIVIFSSHTLSLQHQGKVFTLDLGDYQLLTKADKS